MAASSALPAPILHPQEKYDVFLSFRGADTRYTITSHLRAALRGKKIKTYIDDKLERGDEIAPALVEAIHKSKLSVIIFSKNYASSTWCLDELVERDGQFVIPIFYDINSSHVRKQLGSYADAFAKHEQRWKDSVDKVLMWRYALEKAANLSGTEAYLVETVVEDILTKLNRKSSSDLKGLVAIESQIEQIESSLCIDSPEVCFVGIWGIGGIGKTTLAGAVYDRLSSKFKASCFLANVREESEKHGLNHLRNKLLRVLLEDENLTIDTPSIGSTFVEERLCRTKVLIVLDDVNDMSQLELLAGDHVGFGPGSRIIITTRNRRLLKKKVDDDKIYKVKGLHCDEALQLFHLHAFKNNSPRTDYAELSKMVVDYAEGIPLALKIFGSSFLHCKSKEEWENELKKLKNFPSKKIQNVLRLSYDGLEKNEKEIFLDIACFYKGMNVDFVKRMLDIRGFFVVGIGVLIDTSLISISTSYCLEMHDLVQEIGWEIVREQCIEPGKRDRLFIAEDVCHVLKNNTATAMVQAISFNTSNIRELHLNHAAFKKMYNLRLLEIYDSSYGQKYCKLYLSQGLQTLPESLRYLYWDGYPLKSLPSKFSPENLVELKMPRSLVKQLWEEDLIYLGNLKLIDLSFCKHLTQLPDLSQSRKMEHINLYGCTSLVRIPSCFQYLGNLTFLDLGCCSNLKYLQEMPGNIELLNLESTAIEELPSSVWSNKKISFLNIQRWGCSSLAIEVVPSSIECLFGLTTIYLNDCKRLVSLPTSIFKLKSLKSLDLNGCSNFECFPDILEPTVHLELLNLSKTAVKQLPVEIENLIGLQTLNLCRCKDLEFVPDSIYDLNCLKTLSFYGCLKLKSLPPFSIGLCSLEELNLGYCNILQVPDPLVCLTSLRSLNLSGTRIQSLPASIKQASQLRYLWLTNCKRLPSLPELPVLRHLEAHGCTSLKNAWRNMMGEAQLRIMQMATASSNPTDDVYYGYGPAIPSVSIVCPGNEIPNWFSYQNEGSSINITLPPNWFRTDLLGLALSLVVEFNHYNVKRAGFACTANFKSSNGEGHKISCLLHRLYKGISTSGRNNFNSDYVFAWYTASMLAAAARYSSGTGFDYVTEASVDFFLMDLNGFPLKDYRVQVKKCGLWLLYAEDAENLMSC
ncbi:Putative disease resistance TIR-NBS-LRR class protein [Prunus dulcis]|uniref:ADP-ribosyl cyclase/cyclic ADP-ribose hydrolase n=1 Tax=Prunus dulcis TaxID=3755 RepID=A0A5H2Y3I3_PRUDU|nr:Putative disease resistance TIR-NBS-LRR class protein [Prunus dulcis]